MLQNRNFNIILSVVIALLLWVYVIGEVNPTTTKKFENIPVKLLNTENLASKGLVVLDGDTFMVNLTVEGKRADVLGAALADLLVTADLFGHGLGENYISLNIELPHGLSLVFAEPAKIKVTIDELITANRPVILQYVGTVPEGMEPGQIAINPETVEINGARTLVEQVAYIGADLDVSRMTEVLSITDSLASPYKANGEMVSKVKLSHETVEVSGRLMSTKEVPLRVNVIGKEQPNLQVNSLNIPETITIRGDAANLSPIIEITAKDINIGDYTVSTDIPLELFLPEGVEVAGTSKNLVAKLVIKGLSSKTFDFTAGDVEIREKPEGLIAEILPASLVVSVADRDSVLEEINAGKIHLSLTLAGLGIGTHQIPLGIMVEGYNGAVVVSPQVVTVNLHALQ